MPRGGFGTSGRGFAGPNVNGPLKDGTGAVCVRERVHDTTIAGFTARPAVPYTYAVRHTTDLGDPRRTVVSCTPSVRLLNGPLTFRPILSHYRYRVTSSSAKLGWFPRLVIHTR